MANLDDFTKVSQLAALVFQLIQSQRDMMKGRKPSKKVLKHLQSTQEPIREMISLHHEEGLIPKDDADWLLKQHNQHIRQINLAMAKGVNSSDKEESASPSGSRASRSSSPPKGS